MENLEKKAKELRKKVLDLSLENEGDGHLGGSFSEIEILISLYDKILTKDDKFILSKGHACYPLYVILREKGYNPQICGHPDIDIKNGINCTTGSLGHGLPIGVGMALAKKLKKENGKIFVLMGDAECYEGTTWESSNIARHYKLDNLTLIVDHNKMGALDNLNNILSYTDMKKTFDLFGYHTLEIDGHSFKEINAALKTNVREKPTAIIANTVKGKGVSYMENNSIWHGRKVVINEVEKAYEELK